jgi:DnaJ-class molecular chaperone
LCSDPAYDTLFNDKERQKYERYGKDVFRSIKELTCIDKRNPENPRDERKAPSFKLTIPVSIGDIYNGTVIKAKYPKQQACPHCQGTGGKSPKELKPCSQCAGKGFTLRE